MIVGVGSLLYYNQVEEDYAELAVRRPSIAVIVTTESIDTTNGPVELTLNYDPTSKDDSVVATFQHQVLVIYSLDPSLIVRNVCVGYARDLLSRIQLKRRS